MNKHEYVNEHPKPQDEIPDEVWLKNFIKVHRKLEKELEQLKSYAKGLEEENVLLHKQLDADPDNIFRLKAENEKLIGLIKLNSIVPLQLRQTKYLRSLIRHLNRISNQLVNVLIQHGIEVPPIKPLPKTHPLLGVDVEKLEEQMLSDYYEFVHKKKD